MQIATQSLPGGLVGEPYRASLDAIGGTEPYAWRLLSGSSLPTWAALSGFGQITGVPTTPGTWTFGVEVMGGTVGTALSAQATLRISVVQPLSVTPGQLGGATVGQPFDATFTASGGTAPDTWTQTGLLPLGLSFSSQGATASIRGTPQKTGPADFTLQVSDAANPPESLTVPLVLVVAPAGVGVSGASTATSDVAGGSATAGGAGTGTPNTTVQAMGGTGTVNIADYTSDPGDSAPFAGQGSGYFDVSLANGSSFTSMTITQCNLPPFVGGIWWDAPQGWVFASNQFPWNGCDILNLDAHSTPPISALTGSIFAFGSQPPPPAVTAVAPSQGSAAGAGVVAIDGTDLSDATRVDFGSTTTAQFTVVSPTQIDAVVPPGAGTVDVVVTTPSGSSVATPLDRFTYGRATVYVPPAISGPAPPQPGIGPAGGTLATADGAFTMAVPADSVAPGGILWVGENSGPRSDLPPGLTLTSPIFTLTGSSLHAPQTAALRYNDTALTGLALDRLAVYAQSPDGLWRPQPAALDTTTGTLRVRVSGPEAVAVFAATVTFRDVAATYWAATDIHTLAAAGVVAGFPDGTFRPDQPVTRAQFVTMLDRVLGLAPAANAATPFSDVPAGAWYAPYISIAVRAAIVRGTSPTAFSPTSTLPRQQAAVLLARALKLTRTAPPAFTDADRIAPWAAPAVAEAVAAGLMAGFPDGSFAPDAPLTRAQASRLLALAWQRRAP